mgnify:FL=1
MTEQTFTLPTPPSVNNLFSTVGSRRVKSKTYAAWMQAARWQIAAQRPRLMLGAVAVEIECQRPTKSSDLDNRTKAALDALKGLAWEDDRQVVDLRTRWAEIEGCRITVRQACLTQ